MRLSTAFALTTLATLAACGRGKSPDQPRPAPPVVMSAITDAAIVLADNANVFADSVRLVVRDTIQWKQVWTEATRRQPSPPPRPMVDFQKEMIILAAAGRMKPGDMIHVDSVGTRGPLTVIVVRTTVGCQSFASDAFPFEITRVPRSDGQVQFRELRTRAPECQ